MSEARVPCPEDHQPDWFIADEKLKLGLFPVECLEFFKDYTSLPEDQLLPHILRIRKEAWDFHPYPCIGIFYFPDSQLCKHAAYPEILRAIKSGSKFLDLGCCLGQEMRKLIADGAPSRNLFGADLFPEFVEFGYRLFLDREKLAAGQFIAPADVLDRRGDAPLLRLEGQMDYIHLGSFLHLFSRDRQLIVVTLVSKLFKDKPGAVAIGHQVGSDTPGEYDHWVSAEETSFKHNEESFRKLWSGVPGNWKAGFMFTEITEGLKPQLHKSHLDDPHSRLFRFTVERG